MNSETELPLRLDYARGRRLKPDARADRTLIRRLYYWLAITGLFGMVWPTLATSICRWILRRFWGARFLAHDAHTRFFESICVNWPLGLSTVSLATLVVCSIVLASGRGWRAIYGGIIFLCVLAWFGVVIGSLAVYDEFD